MFNKYEVIKPLGIGHISTVYLVRHISLEQDRVIKVIPHSLNSTKSELMEAQLLKSLNHPGIPQIYDIEEDEYNYYIVEEYINGDSLEHIMLHQQFISLGLFKKIVKQLCDIFIYLHSLKPYPILYRDLKPEHIILCGNQIKLIDFDISLYVSNQGNNFNFLGNQAYSAPECFSDETITIKADIYSLGKILNELYEHLDQSISKNIQQIFQKSINQDPMLRFETVEDFWIELKNELSKSDELRLVKKIAVVGSNHGCGCTHLAVALVSTLNFLGYCATYYEKNKSGDLLNSSQYSDSFRSNKGYIYHRFFRGLPAYGPGIYVAEASDDICVYDYGSDFLHNDILDADAILFVCGGAIWHRKIVTDIYYSLKQNKLSFITIGNMCNPKQSKALSKMLGSKLFSYPYDDNPFSTDKRKCAIFKQLLFKKGGLCLSLEKPKKRFFPKKL